MIRGGVRRPKPDDLKNKTRRSKFFNHKTENDDKTEISNNYKAPNIEYLMVTIKLWNIGYFMVTINHWNIEDFLAFFAARLSSLAQRL